VDDPSAVFVRKHPIFHSFPQFLEKFYHPMKLLRLFCFIFTAALLFGACKSSSNTEKSMNTNDFTVVDAVLQRHPFVKKNGQPMDFQEYYLQIGEDEYFVKFCEGKVESKALEKLENGARIRAKLSIKEGLWDVCDDNRDQQSRVGKYVVLYSLE
jgi:hypothetical protein